MITVAILAFFCVPQDADALVKSAEAKARNRDFNGAIADYTKALEINPQLQKVWFQRAMLKTYSNDDQGAIADYGKAVEVDPAYGLAWFNRGLLRLGRKDHDGAISDLTKAIDLKPTDADTYFNRGNAFAAKGDHDRAVRDYTKSIELKPKYASAYIYRGDCLARRGDPIGAMLDFSKAIEMNPKDAEAYYFRAYAQYDRQAWADAKADFQKAYDLNALSGFRNDYAQLRLWIVRTRLGDPDAGKSLKEYIAKERRGRPDDWVSTIAGFLLGDVKEGHFEAAAGAKVQISDFHFYAGVKRAISKDAAGAKDHFQKCLAIAEAADTPEHVSALMELELAQKTK